MKTILTTIVMILALSYSSSAQQQTPRNQRHEMTPEERIQMQANQAQRQTEQMKTRLTLDEEQAKVIGEINLKYAVLRAQILEAARTEEGLDIRALITELEEKRENEILPFLNENQLDTYFTFKKEQEGRREQFQQNQRQRRSGE